MSEASYPYPRIEGYLWMDTLDSLPKTVCDYLMDLPSAGYDPPTDNSYPRVRLMKHLFYDGRNPLNEPALTTAQKLSLVYDPYHADAPPTDKGYRIFPQSYIAQAQTVGQTILRCYVGRIIADDVYTAQVALTFEIITNMSYETNEKSDALARTIAMEQCLWEALNGVNLGGASVVYMDRRQHGDCGSYPFTDDQNNLGRRVTFGVTLKNSVTAPHT